MSKHYKVVVDAPHAESGGTMERTTETDSVSVIAEAIAGLANDNPGKEFTFKITATEIPE